MGRPKGPDTTVVRLPTDIVEELRRRAQRKNQTLSDYLRHALNPS